MVLESFLVLILRKMTATEALFPGRFSLTSRGFSPRYLQKIRVPNGLSLVQKLFIQTLLN